MQTGCATVAGMATIADTDRAQFDAWVSGQLARIHSHGGNGFDVWDSSKLRRAGLSRTDADAYKGPWRNVRPYATAEFVEWVEQYGNPRWTFEQWRAAMRAERAVYATADAEGAGRAALDTLEYLRDLLGRRGELIAAARDAGASWAEITAASGLSRMQAHTLAKSHRELEPAAELEARAAGYASYAEYVESEAF